MQAAILWVLKYWEVYEVDKKKKIAAASAYNEIQVSNSFRFSLRSMICPAYSARLTAGITSDRPINPIAKGSLVRLYIHHPMTVVSIRMASVKENLPISRFRYSVILTDAKGLYLIVG